VIKVHNEVSTYDNTESKETKVLIDSHWSDKSKVEITIQLDDETLRVTVLGRDLEMAIQNAMNTKLF